MLLKLNTETLDSLDACKEQRTCMTVHFNFYEKVHVKKDGDLYVDFVMIYCMYDIQLSCFSYLPLCECYAVTVGIVL